MLSQKFGAFPQNALPGCQIAHLVVFIAQRDELRAIAGANCALQLDHLTDWNCQIIFTMNNQ
jgi:hypothetical protein